MSAPAEFFVSHLKGRRVYQVCARDASGSRVVITEFPAPNDLAAAHLCDQLASAVQDMNIKYQD